MSILNNQEVLFLINNQLKTIIENSPGYYSGYNISSTLEEDFIKLKSLDSKMIYIVLKCSSASVTFGQTVVPITLTVMSEQNKLEVAQKLLMDYVYEYNLERNFDGSLQQIYQSPVVNSNFNAVMTGFRSILTVTGFLVYSEHAIFTKYYYRYNELKKIDSTSVPYNERNIVDDLKLINHGKTDGVENYYLFTYSDGNWIVTKDLDTIVLGTYNNLQVKNIYGIEINVGFTYSFKAFLYREETPFLTSSSKSGLQLDTQPFYGSNNYTVSEAKIATRTISLATYFLDNIKLIEKAQNIDDEIESVNTTFIIEKSLKNGKGNIKKYKLISYDTQENLGEIPVVSLSFTN